MIAIVLLIGENMIQRRDALRYFGTAFASMILGSPTRAMLAAGKKAKDAMSRRFDPFELEASAANLLSLRTGLVGYASDQPSPRAGLIWLKGSSGQVWAIGVNSRDLQFKFEVFALALETEEQLAERVLTAPPRILPKEFPEWMRTLAAQPPVAPKPPSEFQAWPLRSWNVEVLRRAEYIVGDIQPPPKTIGNDPVAQNPAKPGEVPPEAWASCEVAVGLLFSDRNEKRFLIAVDWMPLNMIYTEDESEIETYVKSCEAIDVTTYASRLS